MNKIELLPKYIVYNDIYYSLGLWITAWDRLCIGYRKTFEKSNISLFSVCVEPENEPNYIVEYGNDLINEGIGNTVSIDDACEEILSYIDKHKEDFEIKIRL